MDGIIRNGELEKHKKLKDASLFDEKYVALYSEKQFYSPNSI